MRYLKLVSICVAAGWFGFVQHPTAHGQGTLYQAPFGPNGSWNVYEVSDVRDQWVFANQEAMDSEFNGVQGHLVSIHSLAENVFVQDIANGWNIWTGLTDREGAAPRRTDIDGDVVPQESETFSPNEQTKGWAWTSGEPLTFHAWYDGEPNEFLGGEDVVHLRSDGKWNDVGGGFYVDEPVVPRIQPDTSPDESEGHDNYTLVIEYPTQSRTMFLDIEAPPIWDHPFLPDTPLPGPIGGPNSLGLREIRNNGTMTGLAAAIESAINYTEGDYVDAQVPIINHSDPDNPGNDGVIVPDMALIGDVVGVDDNDVTAIYRGSIGIANAGPHTFNVHSDDGFVMRIFGAKFSEVFGSGWIDPASADTLGHLRSTSDSRTRGIVDLAAGEHEFEFITWERAGGANWELSMAPGVFQNESDGLWKPVGDPYEAIPYPLPGDADLDRDFDQFDLIKLLVAGKYLTGQAATWGEGDHDGIRAPDSTFANPPVGNRVFDQFDIIAMLTAGRYLQPPYAMVTRGSVANDKTSIIYIPEPSTRVLLSLAVLVVFAAPYRFRI